MYFSFLSSSTEATKVDDISVPPPAECNAVVFESEVSFDDFVTCDDEDITAGTLCHDEIIQSVA